MNFGPLGAEGEADCEGETELGAEVEDGAEEKEKEEQSASIGNSANDVTITPRRRSPPRPVTRM